MRHLNGNEDSQLNRELEAPEAPSLPQTPEGPTQIEKRSWVYIFKRSISEFMSNQCLDGAAALTYYAILALFPALVAIFSLLGIIGQNEKAADAVLGILEQVAPARPVRRRSARGSAPRRRAGAGPARCI